MSDKQMELTRRKVLASLGGIGAAGAAAGYGTTALYTDVEESSNNTIAAGKLDLKVDWEEHYSFPQIYDDFSDPTVEVVNGTEYQLDVTRSNPNDSQYVALPDPENPLVWANAQDSPVPGNDKSSLELYFQNTTIEAFPDRLGGENPEATFTSINSGGQPVINDPCMDLADLPQDRDTFATDSTPARTKNGDTAVDPDANDPEAYPLLNLRDVKPGDFGEFTFSTHLCDNPGYLWLAMPDGLTEKENDLTEPEDEVDGSPNDAELAENVQTALWYDEDCNNRIGTEPDDIVALAVVDTSGSLDGDLSSTIALANALAVDLYKATQNNPEFDVQAGVITFEDSGDSNDVTLANPIVPVDNYVDTSGSQVTGEFGSGDILPPGTTPQGNSPIPQALDVGRDYLNDKAADLLSTSGNDIEGPLNKQMLLISDGSPQYKESGDEEDVEGELIDGSTGSQFSFNGTNYQSDYFDGEANGSDLALPNPNTGGGGDEIAETALVARDIDGDPFVPGTKYSQPAGPKIDKPDNQPEGNLSSGNDPKDISGDNGITVRAAAIYESDNQALSRKTMMAYATDGATGGAFYDINMDGGATVGSAIADDITGNAGTGAGEDVIFRGTLGELEELLDPDKQFDQKQDSPGPLPLDFDRSDGDDQTCYPAGVTHCFGFAWWVPTDVGNEIQSDSVSFDLGFATQQCRNNSSPSPPEF